MNANTRETVPLVCVMDAIPSEERPAHAALTAYLFGEAARERQEIPEGYAFRFAADELASVARFIANERKCCPFLAFELTVPPAEETLWLRVSGPTGAREFLAAELPIRGADPTG